MRFTTKWLGVEGKPNAPNEVTVSRAGDGRLRFSVFDSPALYVSDFFGMVLKVLFEAARHKYASEFENPKAAKALNILQGSFTAPEYNEIEIEWDRSIGGVRVGNIFIVPSQEYTWCKAILKLMKHPDYVKITL